MHDLPLITTIAAAFTAAWVLGLITQRLRLSPIVGYLLAGIVIGPHTPGFNADVNIAMQLSELGVILLMFGVGLHFHLDDLLAVRKVAVPGAIGQSAVATLLGLVIAAGFGMSWESGLVLGMAMAVASTVVLIRVLTDNHMLDTPHGHVAVGWLIVEDVLTVVLLVLIPVLGTSAAAAGVLPATNPATLPGAAAGGGQAYLIQGILAAATPPAGAAGQSFFVALFVALVKLSVLVVILLFAGSRVIPWIMIRVARLRSRELFTLTVMVMAIAVAAASYKLFGASMALGAFLAGMVVGRSPVSNQAAADALPMRDAFAVLFFTAVGMLFDWRFLGERPGLLLAGLGIIMIGKPLAALVIVAVIGYPARTALVVALALAQIGEFSFILSDVGKAYGLVDDDGHNLLVACAIITITLNPLLFRTLPWWESLLKRVPPLWRFMNRAAERRETRVNAAAGDLIERSEKPMAVIVGYGPVGRAVDMILADGELETVIVDQNMDTVQDLTNRGRAAIFGDAFQIEVMHQALARATHLIISLPHSFNRTPLIAAAKLINPDVKVFVRAHYLREREDLEQAGADGVIYEEAEAAVSLSRLVLFDTGADAEKVRRETTRIRQRFMTPDKVGR